MYTMNTYDCTICAVKFARHYHLERHMETKKHKNKTENNINHSTKTFSCGSCSKSYIHRSGLSKHKHQCKNKNKTDEVARITIQFQKEKEILQKQIDDLMLQVKKISDEQSSQQKIPSSLSSAKRKKISAKIRQYIAAKQENSCGQCKQELTPYFQIDHIIGLQFGGTNEEPNLMALCCECHTIKSITENQCRKKIQEAIQNIISEKLCERVVM